MDVKFWPMAARSALVAEETERADAGRVWGGLGIMERHAAPSSRRPQADTWILLESSTTGGRTSGKSNAGDETKLGNLWMLRMIEEAKAAMDGRAQ